MKGSLDALRQKAREGNVRFDAGETFDLLAVGLCMFCCDDCKRGGNGSCATVPTSCPVAQ